LESSAVMGLVGGDLRTLEHEADPAVGKVEADGQLGVSLVDPVAHPDPTSGAHSGVVPVVVPALVEIHRFFSGVHVVVLWESPHLDHGRNLARTTEHALRRLLSARWTTSRFCASCATTYWS